MHHRPQPVARFTRRRALELAAGATIAGGMQVHSTQAQTPRNPFSNQGPPPLVDFLSCVPASLIDMTAAGPPPWYYTDYQQQLDAFGIEPFSGVGDVPEDWEYAIQPLFPVLTPFFAAMMPEFTDALGFQPLAVHQALMAGTNLEGLTLFHGGIDLAALPAAWESAGYEQAVSESGQEFWTLGAPDDFDFDHPVQQHMQAQFNNVTVLDGEIVAFAADSTVLDQIVETRAAGSGSVAADSAVRPLLAQIPETTVSCYAVPGPLLEYNRWSDEQEAAWSDAMAASIADVGPMPPWSTMVVGVLAGIHHDREAAPSGFPAGPDPDGTVSVRIQAASPEDAEQISRVVEHRWNTGTSIITQQPYTELMSIAETGAEGSIATIDFSPVHRAVAWISLVSRQDVFPLIHGQVQS